MNMKFLSKRGFTLIELMVVVAIIAILATMGMFAYRRSMQNARDTQRISDMKAFQAAMEQSFSNNGAYPAATNCNAVAVDFFRENRRPTNPGGGAAFNYTCSSTTAAYCYCAPLEITPSAKGNATGRTNQTCNWATASQTHYCVSNQQ